jgi:hypothetical protein
LAALFAAAVFPESGCGRSPLNAGTNFGDAGALDGGIDASAACPPPPAGPSFFVDSSVATSGDGLSWATAWKNLTDVDANKVQAGAIVYISGGPSRSSQTYAVSHWVPVRGTPSAPITYRIGQDAAHNGTAIFSGTEDFLAGNGPPGTVGFLPPPNNTTIRGDACDGQMHFQMRGYSGVLTGGGGGYVDLSHFRLAYVDMGDMDIGSVAFSLNTISDVEIDHVYCRDIGASSEQWIHINVPEGSWDSNRFHHLTLHLPKNSNGGAGGLLGLSGVTVHDSLIAGYASSTYTRTGGQTALHALGGSYVKVFNNLFVDLQRLAVTWNAEPAVGEPAAGVVARDFE